MRFYKRQRGFTLVEILIVIGLMAILAAVIIPNVTGFLQRGERQAWNGDKRALQAAVDAYYTDPGNRVAGVRQWPTINGTASDTYNASTVAISMPKLVNGNYLKEIPDSAGTATGGTGNYNWYVDSKGRVQSSPAYTAGLYP